MCRSFYLLSQRLHAIRLLVILTVHLHPSVARRRKSRFFFCRARAFSLVFVMQELFRVALISLVLYCHQTVLARFAFFPDDREQVIGEQVIILCVIICVVLCIVLCVVF